MTKSNTKTVAATKTIAAKAIPNLALPLAPEQGGEKVVKAKRPKKAPAVKLARSIARMNKLAAKLAALYAGTPVANDLRIALDALGCAAGEASVFAETNPAWQPERGAGRVPREAIAVGSEVRIAKGVLKGYVALLEDEDEDALNQLVVVKHSEKHSVVKTPGGTKFAIATRLLRRA